MDVVAVVPALFFVCAAQFVPTGNDFHSLEVDLRGKISESQVKKSGSQVMNAPSPCSPTQKEDAATMPSQCRCCVVLTLFCDGVNRFS